MPISIVNHTRFDGDSAEPSAARPITISGRDLKAAAVLHPHHHAWGQFTYAIEGAMRVNANHSSWIVPAQRAVWIPPGVVHGVTTLENTPSAADAGLRRPRALPRQRLQGA